MKNPESSKIVRADVSELTPTKVNPKWSINMISTREEEHATIDQSLMEAAERQMKKSAMPSAKKRNDPC